MHCLKRASWSQVNRAALVTLTLLSASPSLLAQRPLCSQLPLADRDRARTAGLCRDVAPIIDVAPRLPDSPLPPTVPSTASSLTVPNVVGQSFDEARGRLTRFSVQRSYRAAAEPGGTVLAQTPMAPATLMAGAAVTLVLSDGSLVRVPRVTNININDARQRLLKDLDLKAQPVVVTSDLRVGTVIEQQPAEGTLVKRGGVVRLQVSAGQEGPELIDVPNVVGLPFDRAKARLQRFAVERAERPRSPTTVAPNSAPDGQVIDQTPRAASRAVVGSVILLTVAIAPRAAVEVFEMPSIVGRSYADASRLLAEFKVNRIDVENAAPRGQIISQTPVAGSTLMVGDAVALQISAGASVAPPAPASSGSTTPVADAAKGGAASGVLAGVLGISAAVVLGLIVGALVMRQLLLRRRAITAADDAITSLTPHGLTSVDILLEDEPKDRSTDAPLDAEQPTLEQSGEEHDRNKDPGP